MKLYGKKLSRKPAVYDMSCTVTVNPQKGLIKFSVKAMAVLGLGENWVGMSEDEIEVAGVPNRIEPVFYFYKAEEGKGFKVSSTGNVNSRFYARELNNFFNKGAKEIFTLDLAEEGKTFESLGEEFTEMSFFQVSKSEEGIVSPEAKTDAEIPEDLNDAKGEIFTQEEVEVVENASDTQ